MENEIWKSVIGYKDRYEVSNMGRVRSLDKTVKFKDGRIRNFKGKIRKPVFNKDRGYCAVMIYGEDKPKLRTIHQLVAESFLKFKQGGHKGNVVDHINGDKTDNRLVNLQVVTQRTNLSKDQKIGSSKYTGVCWHKLNNKWISSIMINKKIVHLGYFINELDAHNAYQNKLKTII